LTIWKASLASVAAVVIGIALISSPGWSVMLALGAILVTLLVWLPDPLLCLIWAANTLILAWTHRADLRKAPRLRPWLAKYLSGRRG
jgi:hypothetical protein